MSAETAASAQPPADIPVHPRPRPQIHFTADDEWINDPHGITWVTDRYHLFYQAMPGRVTWAPNCQWGHAESADLIHWTQQPPAITPQEFELGCWSGSVIIDDPAEPLIFYTRIARDNWGRGTVAIARGEPTLRTWTTTIDDVVIDGPPPELDAHAFRDPFVFRHGNDWIMIIAAGLPDGSAAALQYRSADLQTWTYDGVLCSRLSTRADDVWTGALWECPQLFPLGDDWVLVVSVWDEHTLHYVAAAVGDYDGRRFTPRRWQRLTYGNSAYAMTTFLDRAGRRCALSWLREEPQNDPHLTERAGAHSLPAVLKLRPDGYLALTPHPSIEALPRTPITHVCDGPGDIRARCETDPIDITVPARSPLTIRIKETGHDRVRITIDPTQHRILIERPGRTTEHQPLLSTSHGSTARIVVDADIAEIFTDNSYGAFRIEPARQPATSDVILHGADMSTTRVQRISRLGEPAAS